MKYTLALPNGKDMPMVGLGTFQGKGDDIRKAVEVAIDAGYRMIDTAYAYSNEEAVGEAINNKIKDGVIKREDIFVVTKLHMQFVQTPELVRECLMTSLKKLNLDYVDLWLNHGPLGVKRTDNPDELFPINKELGHIDWDYSTNVVDTWKSMEPMVTEGFTRAIGVSNFNINQMKRIQKVCTVPISAQQIECHAYHLQEAQYEFCHQHNIALMAYGPIGAAYLAEQQGLAILLKDNVVQSLGNKYKKTPAQICLRFLLEMGRIVIPKSTNEVRIKENFDIFDFQLSDEDKQAMKAINKNENIFQRDESPFSKGVDKHPECPK